MPLAKGNQGTMSFRGATTVQSCVHWHLQSCVVRQCPRFAPCNWRSALINSLGKWFGFTPFKRLANLQQVYCIFWLRPSLAHLQPRFLIVGIKIGMIFHDHGVSEMFETSARFRQRPGPTNATGRREEHQGKARLVHT